MTRRILHFGIGAMAFSLPACLSVGSDLPPHLRTGGAPTPPETVVNSPAPRPVFQPAYIPDPTPPAPVRPAARIDPAVKPTSFNPKPVEAPKLEPADIVMPPKNLKEEPANTEPPMLLNVQAPEWPEIKFDQGVTGPPPYVIETPKPKEGNGQAAKLELPRAAVTNVVPPLSPTVPETVVALPGIPSSPGTQSTGIASGTPNSIPVSELQPPVAEIKPPSPVPPPAPKLPPDSPLVKAVRFQGMKKYEEALDALRDFDPATQELLSNLVQPIVRLSETSMQTMNPDEAALLVERFTAVADLLKTKAALTAGRICYCNGFRRYGDIDEVQRPAFAPGSMACVYVEIKNFLAEPALLPGRSVYESQRRGYRVRLQSHWELRDTGDNVVYSVQDTKIADAKKNDAKKNDLNYTTQHITAPQDYWQVYFIPVPSHLRPGSYTLWIQVTDVPTGRTFRRPIEFRIAG